jgi:hypothetical protein
LNEEKEMSLAFAIDKANTILDGRRSLSEESIESLEMGKSMRLT